MAQMKSFKTKTHLISKECRFTQGLNPKMFGLKMNFLRIKNSKIY